MSEINRDYIKQHNLIGRYVKNQLTPEEVIEFETYFLDKPDLLEEIELETMLYQQLKSAPDMLADKVVDIPRSPQQSKGLSGWSLFSLAAVVLLSVLLAFHFSTAPNTPQFSVGQVVYIDEYRSVSAEHRTKIRVNEGIDELVLVTPVEFHQHDYQVELVREDNNTLLMNRRVKNNSEGEIALTLPGSLLHKGNYLLKLSVIDQPDAQAQQLYLQIIQ